MNMYCIPCTKERKSKKNVKQNTEENSELVELNPGLSLAVPVSTADFWRAPAFFFPLPAMQTFLTKNKKEIKRKTYVEVANTTEHCPLHRISFLQRNKYFMEKTTKLCPITKIPTP